jgi:hypothetical protein
MATSKRTTRKPAATEQAAPEAPAVKPAASLQPEDVARFLGLKDANLQQMSALLDAARLEADKFIGQSVPAEKQGHNYNLGLLHLAAKFYAAGNSDVENDSDLPSVCRYLFVLVRRELSGSEE